MRQFAWNYANYVSKAFRCLYFHLGLVLTRHLLLMRSWKCYCQKKKATPVALLTKILIMSWVGNKTNQGTLYSDGTRKRNDARERVLTQAVVFSGYNVPSDVSIILSIVIQ